MAVLPPVLMTNEMDSFAYHTFADRVPRLLDDIVAWNDYPAAIVANIRRLKEEITRGVIRPVSEEASDRAFWNESAHDQIGKSWLDVPWYWAEAFFYRRVLEAVRYFQPGEHYRRDPYSKPKRAELAPEAGPRKLLALLQTLPRDPSDQFRALMHASLWGNRTDLSYSQVRDEPGAAIALERERSYVLVDETASVWRHLQSAHGRIEIVCDNAGPELLFDLALVDFLIRGLSVGQVVFHVKPQPFFVSDTMIDDVNETLQTLVTSAAPLLHQLGSRLTQAIQEKRFALSDHPFWVTGLFFHSLPADLLETLTHADLVIFKGDANYRRLIGDCHWDPLTPFAAAVQYLPANLVALRTLKAELIVGLKKGEAERLQQEDAAWRVNGKRGVIQFRQK